MKLKDIQSFKYTIPILIGLGFVSIALAVISIANPTPSPLSIGIKQPIAPNSTFDPNTLAVAWDKIKLGSSPAEIEKILGKPVSTSSQVDLTTMEYLSTTPPITHTVRYKKDKAIKITRFVNERKERITPDEFKTTYGKGEIIRPGVGSEYQLESYRVNNNDHLIITVDKQFNVVYQIIYVVNSEYEATIKELTQDEEHTDIAPF